MPDHFSCQLIVFPNSQQTCHALERSDNLACPPAALIAPRLASHETAFARLSPNKNVALKRRNLQGGCIRPDEFPRGGNLPTQSAFCAHPKKPHATKKTNPQHPRQTLAPVAASSSRMARFTVHLSIRRGEIPHSARHRRNFIPLFYGVSEIFLRPRKIPIRNFSCKGTFGLFSPS